MTTYFYQRISTKESSDKQSFQRQDKSLRFYAKSKGIEYDERDVYKDDMTGSTFERPEWLKLEARLNPNDTIIFKEISRFTRQAERGYEKYMELMNKGINLVFIDNPTVSTSYIKQLMNIADSQQLVAKTALESTIKLLLIVELDRVQQEREIIAARIKQGIDSSEKTQGRKKGQLDKMTLELKNDIIAYIGDRSIKQVDVMKKHNISRNTLKKYAELVKSELNKIGN